MLKAGAGAGAALLLGDVTVMAQAQAQTQAQARITRTIPSSGESIPAVGLGSARTFSRRASADERGALKEVLRLFTEMGGSVFDTAPTYGLSESVAGALAQELGIENNLFFATKISTGFGRSSGVRQTGVRQQEASMRLWGRDMIDLNQVHNLGGVEEHLPTLRQAKEEGRTRYVGVTISRLRQFGDMEQVMKREPLDFIQINYSLGERQAAERILPLARDRGFGVVINEPYNAGRLFRAVSGASLPEWAADFDCESWGQFFLKYILSHPAVTVVIPGTSDPEHLVDNMGAGVGRLPDEGTRRRMEEFFDRLS
jgi:aryl-alcohol dehydrogenase-like predicted oxidoreductase